jgi:hypothetical protein
VGTRLRIRVAALAVALGLLVSVAGPALAENRGCYVTANVPNNGAWVIYNWYMYHNPFTGDERFGEVQVFDNVRNGIGIGFADAGGHVYDPEWRHIAPGDTAYHSFQTLYGYWSTTVAYNYAIVHPAAMMWGSGCGIVLPWDSCDVHFQANYLGFGWQKNW